MFSCLFFKNREKRSDPQLALCWYIAVSVSQGLSERRREGWGGGEGVPMIHWEQYILLFSLDVGFKSCGAHAESTTAKPGAKSRVGFVPRQLYQDRRDRGFAYEFAALAGRCMLL